MYSEFQNLTNKIFLSLLHLVVSVYSYDIRMQKSELMIYDDMRKKKPSLPLHIKIEMRYYSYNLI